MKKGTKIALICTIVYCSAATYVALTTKINYKGGSSTYSELVELLFAPGSLLGFIGLHLFGIPAFIIGQVFSFIVLFLITKAIINIILDMIERKKRIF
jgi:hypothetical protein